MSMHMRDAVFHNHADLLYKQIMDSGIMHVFIVLITDDGLWSDGASKRRELQRRR